MAACMPDGSDPGRVEHYTDRQVERVRRCVREPNRSDILKTIRRGRRGNIPSPKPNQRTKPSWANGTVLNNARQLRILAGQLQGLDTAEYEGTTWAGREGRDEYPDRLLDCSPEQVTELIAEMSIEREWARSNERDYCLSVRNHFLAHDREETATQIDYPQVGQENAAVDVETVPTREELLELIDGECIRDKAMYAVLWESGCRVTALTSLKVRHWTPKGEGYGIVQVPGTHVEGLKGAEHSAKPITFSRGYLDNWLAEHARPDDPDAPLFHGIRPQDDPSEHLHPHSVHQQLKRIARRTEGVEAEHISPHTFKHGRASEMRASEKYSKDDVEQILDWEEGTPMHGRYEHVTEVDEAERILRKHGHEPEEGGDAVEQHPCSRCGTMVDEHADYCPSCSLRQQQGHPRWWRIYREISAKDDPVRQHFEEELAPASLAQLSPSYYEHVLDVYALALVRDAVADVPVEEPDVDVSGVAENPDIDEEDAAWLRDRYPEIEERHRSEHPASPDLRQER
jgi:integrase